MIYDYIILVISSSDCVIQVISRSNSIKHNTREVCTSEPSRGRGVTSTWDFKASSHEVLQFITSILICEHFLIMFLLEAFSYAGWCSLWHKVSPLNAVAPRIPVSCVTGNILCTALIWSTRIGGLKFPFFDLTVVKVARIIMSGPMGWILLQVVERLKYMHKRDGGSLYCLLPWFSASTTCIIFLTSEFYELHLL